MTDFEMMIGEARHLASDTPGAQQVIVVRSSKGNTYHFTNACASSDEDRFLDTLREMDDTAIEALVCMWHDFQLDVPSMHLRKELLALDPANAAAALPLQGESGIVVRHLEQLM